uniref:Clustered mitochondria protein homolog n=1 Tax=Rhizophora mucronata TaxID=61149 RepID=A0A2P2ITY5_RHIMU
MLSTHLISFDADDSNLLREPAMPSIYPRPSSSWTSILAASEPVALFCAVSFSNIRDVDSEA